MHAWLEKTPGIFTYAALGTAQKYQRPFRLYFNNKPAVHLFMSYSILILHCFGQKHGYSSLRRSSHLKCVFLSYLVSSAQSYLHSWRTKLFYFFLKFEGKMSHSQFSLPEEIVVTSTNKPPIEVSVHDKCNHLLVSRTWFLFHSKPQECCVCFKKMLNSILKKKKNAKELWLLKLCYCTLWILRRLLRRPWLGNALM